jgi:hypothetical protein
LIEKHLILKFKLALDASLLADATAIIVFCLEVWGMKSSYFYYFSHNAS